ncbi:zinc ribbon domain-containing protein [Brevibacillus ruminantium]|uniref:Zinc ribbon domain-containing protein n=1 Tax=Brevibacillus ruminantium TaxID=2950604 RepID=A0ABY4WHL7_9BACL|nr:zinc ribbon domain-containing protein [Brevibacillus ruminantium]USG64834.1 zinc ribbon domain-containing protein [Brevibacillus ruminantium]
MMNTVFCQSCSMPMNDAEILGTEQDGTKNQEYCKYCYQNGAFTQPGISMEQMIDICVPYLQEDGMDEHTARHVLQKHLPLLKRWSSTNN